jgi:hypothetical protein
LSKNGNSKKYDHNSGSRFISVAHTIGKHQNRLSTFNFCVTNLQKLDRLCNEKNFVYLCNGLAFVYLLSTLKNITNHGKSGVDVMITIFCDFCQFSAKNWRFSQKSML